jgi:hypothetical protein
LFIASNACNSADQLGSKKGEGNMTDAASLAQRNLPALTIQLAHRAVPRYRCLVQT